MDKQSLFIGVILIASESMQYDISIDSVVYTLTLSCGEVLIVGRYRCIDDRCALCTVGGSAPCVCLWLAFLQSGSI